jgi:DNA processing protein
LLQAPEDFEAWLRLLETPGLGRGTARRLLVHFGSPEAIFAAPESSLRQCLPQPLLTALLDGPPLFDVRREAARRWLRGDVSRRVVTLGDPAYPQRLLQTADPPLVLYAQGRLDLLNADSVAVVGSRRPTPQGASNAHTLARQLSERSVTVVSGLAQGIDGAAHAGALEGAGSTVAVVGTGLDIVYPSRHKALARRIEEQGLLLSEFAPGTPPLPEHFPLRNRIIAGLSLGTLVVEAALRSGSLITARLALEAGRDVYAVPGSIHAAQSQGCHALIKQGAKLVESVDDIFEELHIPPPAASAAVAPLAAAEHPVMRALGHDAVTLDTLAACTGWPAAELSAWLLERELEGQVARLPGGLYQRLHTG